MKMFKFGDLCKKVERCMSQYSQAQHMVHQCRSGFRPQDQYIQKPDKIQSRFLT